MLVDLSTYYDLHVSKGKYEYERKSSDLLLGSVLIYAKQKALHQSLCLRLSIDENATMNVS